jgi:hypothetical protein
MRLFDPKSQIITIPGFFVFYFLFAVYVCKYSTMAAINKRDTQLKLEFVANRLLHAGKLEVFFNDTQLEVYGKNFEGVRINYNGDCALSWQTLWVGPLLVDSHLESPGNPSSQLLPMLERNRYLWRGRSAHFYCDSASRQ